MKSTWGSLDESPVSESELQAYVDGQLPVSERVRIEAYLAVHPSEAERLAAYRKQNIGLHALFDTAGDDDDLTELPPEMLGAALQLEQEVQTSDKRRTRFRLLTIICILVFIAGGVGWGAGWITRDYVVGVSDADGGAAKTSEQPQNR